MLMLKETEFLFCFQNGMFELNRLLTFLELDMDEKMKRDILEMCHLDRMKEEVSFPAEFLRQRMCDRGGSVSDETDYSLSSFYRKGLCTNQ